MSSISVHPSALVDTSDIGEGTAIWAFVHIMQDVSIGKNCNICDHVFIEPDVRIGDGVTVKNSVLLWSGVEVKDYAYIGPNVVFTNDKYPRSRRLPAAATRYEDEDTWLVKTVVEQGASIGANATILCGVHLGKYCMIAAGSVVTKNVAPYSIVVGNPARPVGYVDEGGQVLKKNGDHWENPDTHTGYRIENDELLPI